MPTKMNKKDNPKIPRIIDCTLEVLRNDGEQGLSMRKVAAKAGMSLGNLQFYFKNKDELLAGMVDVYFDRCYADFNNQFLKHSPVGKNEIIRFLVEYGMDYTHSEIGQVFRQLWGMASRNERIRQQLNEYYTFYADELTKMLMPFAEKNDSVFRAVTLLISYFDGNGLLSCPLPSDRTEMSEYIVTIVQLSLKESL